MGIFKSCYLAPERAYLLMAEVTYLRCGGRLIYALALVKYLHKKLLCGKVGDSLFLVWVLGVKNGVGLGVIYLFAVAGDKVGNGLAGGLVVKSPKLLEIGSGYLGNIFRKLYLGDYLSVLFNGCELVNSAENRLAP